MPEILSKDIPELLAEEKEKARKSLAKADELLASAGRAKYKIELMLRHNRSVWKPTVGVIVIWESGTRLNGEGDTSMYFCPGKLLGRNNCEGTIPSDSITGAGMVCSECGLLWKESEVKSAIAANLTMRGWAVKLYDLFVRLNFNADLLLRHAKEDVRIATEAEQERQLGGEVLGRVRSQRALQIYQLRNIIKDTSSGADTLSRFYAFLTA
jgi:hypothetical protein